MMSPCRGFPSPKSLLLALSIVCCVGCEEVYRPSDYQGGFYTTKGDCRESGEITITYARTTTEVVQIKFHCFLKTCAQAEGKVVQGGFFHVDLEDGQYIEGRIKGQDAEGSWFLNLESEACTGYWAALKN